MGDERKRLRKQFDNLRNKGLLAEHCGIVCVSCGAIESIDYHHILPLSLGGDNRYSNIVQMCCLCHDKIHGNGVRLTRWRGNVGRRKESAPIGYREVLVRYVTGEIGMDEAKEALGLSKGARVAEKWYYKEFL